MTVTPVLLLKHALEVEGERVDMVYKLKKRTKMDGQHHEVDREQLGQVQQENRLEIPPHPIFNGDV